MQQRQRHRRLTSGNAIELEHGATIAAKAERLSERLIAANWRVRPPPARLLTN